LVHTRGVGGKRVHRVNLSMTNFDARNLNRLATSCNLRPTALAALLVVKSLNDPSVIKYLQDEYNLYKEYEVLPIWDHNTGRTELTLRGS